MFGQNFFRKHVGQEGVFENLKDDFKLYHKKLSNVCLNFQRWEESLQYSAKELNGQCIIEKLS